MSDVTIIGAGPAGMAAAVTLVDCGVRPVVVDEQQAPGGQIFRQPPAQFRGHSARPGAGYRWGADLVDRCRNEDRIDWQLGTTAWAVLRDQAGDEGAQALVAVRSAGTTGIIPSRRVLMAAGAYDMPVAVPGWTLPGVLTAGAAQSLLKSQRLRPGRRFVLAGSHPLLLVVADQLLASGADLAEIAILRGGPSVHELVAGLGALPGHVGLLRESLAAYGRIRRAGVPVSTATVLSSVGGQEAVASARLVTVDRAGMPSGAVREVDCDTVVLGYGFLPSTDLARQAGCGVRWWREAGGWVVEHDESMRTSVPDIYVAGEPAGVAGAEQSRAEGVVAGLAIAADLGAISEAEAARRLGPALRRLRRARRFSSVVQRMFPPPFETLATWATDDTIICRCELATGGEVRRFLAENPHVSKVNAVKLECRTGMGPCQGRYCQSTVASITARERALPLADVGTFTAQAPARPVPLSALVSLGRVDPSVLPSRQRPSG